MTFGIRSSTARAEQKEVAMISNDHKVDVIVRTRNSGSSLRNCLQAAADLLPVRKFIIIDRYSKDETRQIAAEFDSIIKSENTGLGFATKLGIESAETPNIIFLDSDVTIIDANFYSESQYLLKEEGVGAVVGQARGHIFRYGLPLGLTMMPLQIARKIKFMESADSRETYYIQQFFRSNKLKVKYVNNSMLHHSEHRSDSHWPEWQGAWVRITSGLNLREVIYSLLVVFLMLTNSRKIRNFLFIPVFQAKILRGYIHPYYWSGKSTSARDKIMLEQTGEQSENLL